jgi:hypothetical protein
MSLCSLERNVLQAVPSRSRALMNTSTGAEEHSVSYFGSQLSGLLPVIAGGLVSHLGAFLSHLSQTISHWTNASHGCEHLT